MTELLKGAGAFVCGDKTPLDLRGRTQKRHQEPAVIPRFQPSQGTPVWGPGTSDSGHHPIYQLEPRALQGPDLSNFRACRPPYTPSPREQLSLQTNHCAFKLCPTKSKRDFV